MLSVGDLAKDFKLSTPEGKSLSLFSKLKTSPVLLVFYKYDCPTCQFTFKYLPRIAQGVGVDHFLAVAQDPPKLAADFIKKYQIGFDVVCDEHPYPVSAQYGFHAVPGAFVIGSDRKITSVAEGFDREFLEDFSMKVSGVQAFQPQEQVPLLKPG